MNGGLQSRQSKSDRYRAALRKVREPSAGFAIGAADTAMRRSAADYAADATANRI